MSTDGETRTIYVVDDNPTLRKVITTYLKERLSNVPSVRFHEAQYIWELLDLPDLSRGDIALSDLYSGGYWSRAPRPFLYPVSDPLADDVGNIVRGCYDATARFLNPLQHKRGIQIYLSTFVPEFLRHSGKDDLAQHVVQMLKDQGFAGFYEKIDQSVDPRNFEAPCNAVSKLFIAGEEEVTSHVPD